MDVLHPPLRRSLARAALALLLALAPALAAQQAPVPLPRVAIDPTTGVPGVTPAQIDPGYWIARLPDPDREWLDRAGVAAQNARMRALDPYILDLRALPAPLPRQRVLDAIQALSVLPVHPLYDPAGQPVPAAQLAAWQDALALDAIPPTQPLRYGLVVHRAALRTFPTAARVFSRPGDNDIDRLQESALFPGDAVAVLHASRDGRWLFVASERYQAWIEAAFVATGSAEEVFGYAAQGPYRVVTGATAFTAYTPEEPRVSRLQLDMGVRVPVVTDWPPARPLNGQLPYTGWVVRLPVRNDDGSLGFAAALLPRTADTSADYLPLTPRNLLAQAFKFLGERYGWGHEYDNRDCSGFVSEIYRSLGVLVPRNTSAQAVSPALARIGPGKDADRTARLKLVAGLQVGDLVYIPGHVMVVIGHDRGLTYIIHDTAGGGWAGPDGRRMAGGLNGVAVTPLEAMLASDDRGFVDLITSIQRVPADPPPLPTSGSR
ncbi:MAG: SH3 domain-containing protein [Pseudoxanthomonas sp.]